MHSMSIYGTGSEPPVEPAQSSFFERHLGGLVPWPQAHRLVSPRWTTYCLSLTWLRRYLDISFTTRERFR